jgi:AraC-like DNA-binding protein
MSAKISIERPAGIDPLESVLALVDARGERVSTLAGRGGWAVRFPAPNGAKFNAVLAGACTVHTDGLAAPLRLETGDSFLLTRPQEFILATSAEASEQPASPLFRASDGQHADIGAPGEPVTAELIGGSFTFDRRARELLLDSLPPLIHLPADAGGAPLVPALLHRLKCEAQQGQVGASVISQHLAVVLLVDMIRHHLTQGAPEAGWLRGLTDPIVALTLRAIHADPSRSWTVELLAAEAGVSRSTLAHRFKATVGQAPLEYLTRWRLELGVQRLLRSEETVASVAAAVGYGSETAFALAFKREFGTPPGRFRRTSQERTVTRERWIRAQRASVHAAL